MPTALDVLRLLVPPLLRCCCPLRRRLQAQLSLSPGAAACGVASCAAHRLPALRPTSAGPLGSPGFVAPEIVAEGVHTPAMDVFSLGVLLFIMLVRCACCASYLPVALFACCTACFLPPASQVGACLLHSLSTFGRAPQPALHLV